jgi:hypothetical protein
MKAICTVAIFVIFLAVSPKNTPADTPGNRSSSLDPFSFVGLIVFFIPTDDVTEGVNFNNLWFTVEWNWESANQREMGVGITLRGDRVALTSTYRFFHNRETQSGFFWGPFALLEWRRMYWFYDEDDHITIGWSLPFRADGNTFHSVGITAGIDIGYRFRRNNFGVTAFIGLGVPLFYPFGNLPPQDDFQGFYLANMMLRSLRAGLRLNFFR